MKQRYVRLYLRESELRSLEALMEDINDGGYVDYRNPSDALRLSHNGTAILVKVRKLVRDMDNEPRPS